MLVAESRMVMGKAHVFHVGSLSKYLHRKDNGKPDWRYNEVRAARDVIASMLKNGDLKI